MYEFYRIKRLPPYVFAIVNHLKMESRRQGEDIIDLGMGNPDLPTPKHIVDKLCEAARNPKNHRYSASKGITQLRVAITEWFKRRFDVDGDPETEAVITIGSKEGLSHLALAMVQPGDVIMSPTPAYPIHPYAVIIAGGEVSSIPIGPGVDFFAEMEKTFKKTWPRPKILIINFPHNPTTAVLDGSNFSGRSSISQRKIISSLSMILLMQIYSSTAIRHPAFCRCREQRTSVLSFSRSPKVTQWQAGGSDSVAGTGK